MSSSIRRGGAKSLRILQTATGQPTPPAADGEICLFVQESGGVVQLFQQPPVGPPQVAPIVVNPFFVLINAVAGEVIATGEVIAKTELAGVSRAVLADADGAGTRQNVIGIAKEPALIGATFTVIVGGEAVIPDVEWDVVPGVSSVGEPVYMSVTSGNLTLVAPSTGTIQKVGILIEGGAGTSSIVVQIGDVVRQ